jgi:hypothetical protein
MLQLKLVHIAVYDSQAYALKFLLLSSDGCCDGSIGCCDGSIVHCSSLPTNFLARVAMCWHRMVLCCSLTLSHHSIFFGFSVCMLKTESIRYVTSHMRLQVDVTAEIQGCDNVRASGLDLPLHLMSPPLEPSLDNSSTFTGVCRSSCNEAMLNHASSTMFSD